MTQQTEGTTAPSTPASGILIRRAAASDSAAIWSIIEAVIRTGETYALPRNMTREDALAYWLDADRQTFVAIENGAVSGTYYLRANQQGGGAHVANCGYVTAASSAGRGIARTMCLHSLKQARESGFKAMQFNCVVSTNVRAVTLWQALGFDIAGRLPRAFDHPTLGFVDALVMYKLLD